jgi:hypothetical protein
VVKASDGTEVMSASAVASIEMIGSSADKYIIPRSIEVNFEMKGDFVNEDTEGVPYVYLCRKELPNGEEYGCESYRFEREKKSSGKYDKSVRVKKFGWKSEKIELASMAKTESSPDNALEKATGSEAETEWEVENKQEAGWKWVSGGDYFNSLSHTEAESEEKSGKCKMINTLPTGSNDENQVKKFFDVVKKMKNVGILGAWYKKRGPNDTNIAAAAEVSVDFVFMDTGSDDSASDDSASDDSASDDSAFAYSAIAGVAAAVAALAF